jgi:hypothetical protein
MVTKMSFRAVVGCSWVAMTVLGVVGCIAASPVVGREDDGVDDSEGGSGRVDLIGTAEIFAKTAIVGAPDPELCLPRKLPLDSDGTVACTLFSARNVSSGECRCDERSRSPIVSSARRIVDNELTAQSLCGGPTGIDCSDYCVCEEPKATGADLHECLHNLSPPPSGLGWCYIDPARGFGAEELVAKCPESQRQRLQMLSYEAEAIYFVGCSGGRLAKGTAPQGPGAIGAFCLPSNERDPDVHGFALSEVELEFGSPECGLNICLVNHFQGRASCPYGQATIDVISNAPKCFLPDSDVPLSIPVDPQLVARRAHDTVVCSCRCDGPDPDASYCQCPSGMECAPVAPGRGAPGEEAYVGSYCILQGTRYDPGNPPPADPCRLIDINNTGPNCGDARPY